MQTLRLCPDTQADALAIAARLLARGEVVGIPTETVYGLAADALNPEAVAKIFVAKGRPQDNPLIVHIAKVEDLHRLCTHVPPSAWALARAFWPGPLTMVLPKADCVPSITAGGLSTVGVRLPSHPIARQLIERSGVPLAAPSANRSGRPSTTTATHVLADCDGKIAAVVDGGACTVGVESTVISLAGDVPRLLRPGGITLAQLEHVLGKVEVDKALYQSIGEAETVSAPGMKYRHYAPKAPVTVVRGNPHKTATYIQAHAPLGAGVLCFDEFAQDFAGYTVHTLGSVHDIAAQARTVFDALRRFDETSVPAIFAQCPSDEGLGLAVANRLQKAAGFHCITVEG